MIVYRLSVSATNCLLLPRSCWWLCYCLLSVLLSDIVCIYVMQLSESCCWQCYCCLKKLPVCHLYIRGAVTWIVLLTMILPVLLPKKIACMSSVYTCCSCLNRFGDSAIACCLHCYLWVAYLQIGNPVSLHASLPGIGTFQIS